MAIVHSLVHYQLTESPHKRTACICVPHAVTAYMATMQLINALLANYNSNINHNYKTNQLHVQTHRYISNTKHKASVSCIHVFGELLTYVLNYLCHMELPLWPLFHHNYNITLI